MTGPTFNDFIVATHSMAPTDHVVVQPNGLIGKADAHAPPDADANRRTWQAFTRAVNAVFTPQRTHFIAERYGGADWWQRMTTSDLPFKKRNIECFGVGAALCHTHNLGEKEAAGAFLPEVSTYSVAQVRQLYQSATQHGYIGQKEDPRTLAGSPRETHQHLAQDYYLMDKQRMMLFQGLDQLISEDPNIPWNHPYYSRLTMGIISLLETQKNGGGDIRDLGMIIPAPTSAGKVDDYYVHDIIAYKGLTAFALAPVSNESTLPPLLAFRCTKQAYAQGDFYHSMYNDAEPRPGESGWQANEEAFDRLMRDTAFTKGKKIVLTAYSLGGAQAGYFLRKHWKQVEEFVGFNFLGNAKDVVEDFAAQINALAPEDVPPRMYIHRNHGDWVPKAGDKQIGWGITHPNAICKVYDWDIHDYLAPSEEFSIQNGNRSLHRHAVRPLEFLRVHKYSYTLHTTPRARDEALRGDQVIESYRQEYGVGLFHRYVSMLWSLVSFILRLFGLEALLRENRQ